jgi:hypothetical protein
MGDSKINREGREEREEKSGAGWSRNHSFHHSLKNMILFLSVLRALRG